ncbi:hypothetical protein [Leucobacter chromiiresistens]|uniref:Uncharacterized protein n=1 Tax=Leucobacter chromiiresistens TaxID=1079994 RepID=A0A147EFK6_9MICO|nr:hypothetical protein [Leucobacter chromiiresistens]KTR83223.1 hypothetical protein NS354_10640 [Leucobacter chromiiresistens]
MSAHEEDQPRRRRPRRATRPAAPGVDEHPSVHPLTGRAAEDRPEGWGGQAPALGTASAHDEALKRDRPPHWA